MLVVLFRRALCARNTEYIYRIQLHTGNTLLCYHALSKCLRRYTHTIAAVARVTGVKEFFFYSHVRVSLNNLSINNQTRSRDSRPACVQLFSF